MDAQSKQPKEPNGEPENALPEDALPRAEWIDGEQVYEPVERAESASTGEEAPDDEAISGEKTALENAGQQSEAETQSSPEASTSPQALSQKETAEGENEAAPAAARSTKPPTQKLTEGSKTTDPQEQKETPPAEKRVSQDTAEQTPAPQPTNSPKTSATPPPPKAPPPDLPPETMIIPPPPGQPPQQPPPPPPEEPSKMPMRHNRSINWWHSIVRWSLRLVFSILLIGLFIGGALTAFGVYKYYTIAASLPSVDNLRKRASHFETTRILDRNGDVLYEILDPNAGRRTYVPLSKISPYMVAATIATEDKHFYEHPGIDIWAIARAFWQNYTSGEIVSGASTITQQLARALLLSPEERNKRTYDRKLREAILAIEITRRYSKDEILELYLNEVYYGNLAYGVEAAAETYFHTTADKLTLAQAAFLAGLPQAPAVYDPYTNRKAAMQRFRQVLTRLYETSQEMGCISVSNSPHPICVSAQDVAAAWQQMQNYKFPSPNIPMRFPHWVNYIRSLLEKRYDPQTIYRSGFTVYTTLDPTLQEKAQEIVRKQVKSLAAKHVTDGALVAIRPTTGEILAMVGSADYYNKAIHGQVNMALAPRQPGSSIKPYTYLAAFEKGWTPATLIWDVPSEFPPSGNPNDPRPPYKPVNYDHRFHGPVTVRIALANSFNVPAVKALQFVGIYDDPKTPQKDGLIGMAERLGITTLTRKDYGLSLTLGGGEVTLLEHTGAYAVMANGGKRVPPVAITKIVDYKGHVVYQYTPPPGKQVIRAEHAYLITSILSDNNARAWEFGYNSPLHLPFPAAAKTGTTNDFRDNWTMGYTPDIAVGVWVGNADNSPMINSTGLTGAAPIWSAFMQFAEDHLTNGHPTPFVRPPGIVDEVICAISGTRPSKWCPKQRTEVFAYDQPPLPASDDLWQFVPIDTWTQLAPSKVCNPDGLYSTKWLTIKVSDPWARKWLRNTKEGRSWAAKMGFKNPVIFTPDRECKASDPRPLLKFVYPADGTVITEPKVDVIVQADATKYFKDFRIEARTPKDKKWHNIYKSNKPVPKPDKVAEWNISEMWDWEHMPTGKVLVRMYMHSTVSELNYAIRQITVTFNIPTPTPTPTATPTPTTTPTPTQTSTPTPTPSPTPTATPTPAPTSTPTPTSSPTPTPTPMPTVTPSTTPTPTQTPTPIPTATPTP